MAETTLANIPDKTAAPKVGQPPKHQPKSNNLAGDDKLTEKFWEWASTNYEYFNTQGQRKKFCDTDGTMDVADRMYRVALRRQTTSKQHQNTLSDVASTMFFRQIRTITASERMIFLQDGELPAEFEPEQNTDEYTASDGKWIADQHNMLERHTFDEDNRREKIKRSVLFNNKYAQEMVSIEWDRKVELRVERVPAKFLDGKPVAFTFKEVERVAKDCPALIRHDLKDCYFDAQLNDMQLQRCFLVKQQKPWEELAADQRQGKLMNVGKLTDEHLYTGESGESETQEDRLQNADIDATTEATGLLEIWQVWARVPISEKAKGKGKGKWDEKKNAPELYWATFAGKPGQKALCLRLIKNPYNHKKIPFKLLHSHEDDIGAYHMGFSSMLEPGYWQVVTNLNQAIDNVSLRNLAPFTVDGAIHTRDLAFRANKLIRLGRGVKLERLEPSDTTRITMEMHDRIERDADKTTGADKPVLGEALGSRASATEARQVLDQALLPIDDKAQYVADQLFPWMLELDAALWRQYGDPERVLSVTHNNIIQEIEPTKLWGPIKIQVTAVTRFRNNAIRRQEVNSFIQNALPLAAPIMGQKGQRIFWRNVFHLFGIKRASEIFPETGDYDAEHRALEGVHLMMNIGQWVEPLPDENHTAWLAVLEPAAREYALLPAADADTERLRMLREHIEIRKNLVARAQAQTASASGAAGGAGGPALPGEVEGAARGGEMGGLSGA